MAAPMLIPGDNGERQWTVITSQWGNLRGHRIVRGREQECLDYYEVEQSVAVGARVNDKHVGVKILVRA